MKSLFVLVLVFNLLLEGFAGVSLIMEAEAAFSDTPPEGMMWNLNYGFTALAIASVIIWVWPHRNKVDVVGVLLGFLLSFHGLVTIALIIPGNQYPVAMIHGIMALLCLVLYVRKNHWCKSES